MIASLFMSCDDKDDPYALEKEEHLVKVVVYSNTPDVPIAIYGFTNPSPLYIKDYWEREISTKFYRVGFRATCDDPTTLITGELYIDGKLQGKQEGNRYISLGAKIK